MGDAPRYKRILIKISGESLAGHGGYGIDPAMVDFVCRQMKRLHETGIQIGLVVGGGNIFRGLKGSKSGMDRVTGDQMGMLATVINSLALRDDLERRGVPVRVLSAVAVDTVCEKFVARRAVKHLEKWRLVIMAGGTGNPFFTTDTAAALRAVEIGAQVILKGTRVDGVYSADPEIDPKAVLYSEISYIDVLSRELRVMDAASIALCKENNLPVLVFNLHVENNLYRAGLGDKVGTLVH